MTPKRSCKVVGFFFSSAKREKKPKNTKKHPKPAAKARRSGAGPRDRSCAGRCGAAVHRCHPAHLLRPNPPAGHRAPRPPSFAATPPAAARAARGGAGLTAALCPQPNDGERNADADRAAVSAPRPAPGERPAAPQRTDAAPQDEEPHRAPRRQRSRPPAHRGLLQDRQRSRVPRSGSAPRHRRQPEPRAPGAAPTPAPLPGTHRPEEVRPEAETAGRTGGGPRRLRGPVKAEAGGERPRDGGGSPRHLPPAPGTAGSRQPGGRGAAPGGGGRTGGRREERRLGSGETAQILGALRPLRSALRPIPRRRAAATESRGRAPVRGWAARSARSRRRPPRSERRPPAPLPYSRRRRRRRR